MYLKKTILVNYPGRSSGGASHAYEMAKAIMENGAEVYAVISRQVENLSDWQSLPINIVYIDTYTDKKEFLVNTVAFYLQKRYEIKKSLGDVIFNAIYVPMGTYWTWMISELFPDVPVYYTIHDPAPHSGENLFNRIYTIMYRKEIQKAKGVITLSEKFVDDIVKLYGVSKTRIKVIPQGAFWQYKSKYIAHEKYSDDKRTNFLFFGRIEKYKGVGVLVKAYGRLEKELKNKVTLTIAGNGDLSEYAALMSDLDNLTVKNYVIPDEQVGELFDKNNVVTVLPYLDASQSGVVLTAYMFNSLVIASDTGALREQLKDGELGVLVKPNSVKDLYENMKKVAVDIDSFNHLKENALIHIEDRKWEKLGRKLLDFVD